MKEPSRGYIPRYCVECDQLKACEPGVTRPVCEKCQGNFDLGDLGELDFNMIKTAYKDIVWSLP